MSDYIPFEIQSEIIKRFPVKSLLQFRSVSKQWKSLIDSSDFIKNYHMNHPNLRHHLLVLYKLGSVRTYTSIIDDNTFPQQKFPLTAPELLNFTKTLGFVDGLLCFYGWYKDNMMVVLWNPSIRKSVGIPVSNVLHSQVRYTRIGFGVCPDTSDPKLVKINVFETSSIYWEVQVFRLSSRVWRTVYTGAPFKLCDLMFDHVFIDGIIYWLSHDGRFIISFDLKSDKFGEVCLPERSKIGIYELRVAKVNESLGLLEYKKEGETWVCGVWMRKDGNKPFTKIYTVKVEGKSVLSRVLGFRNNGEVLLQLDDDDDFNVSQMEVYEPSSGRINSVGISGRYLTFSAWSYMETLLLLNQSNSIIH